ncbi:MAG: ABC transporter [Methanobacteriota archaeon]|nr:MAG: ABC transporter [Euryarchaeota archaeon]
MSEFEGLYGIWLREFKVFQREKSRVVSAIAQPIIWLFLLGGGIGASIDTSRIGNVDYQHFLFPGIVAMSTMFGTVFYGLYIVWDRKIDVLKEILVAPISRITVFFGKVLGGATDAMITVFILLLLGVVLVGISPVGVVAGLGIALLLAVGMVSIGLTLGAFFESMEGFQVIITFMIFPLFFLSGALYPISGLDPVLGTAVQANPVTYAVDGLRGALIGQSHFPLWLDVGIMLLFDAAMVLLGTWAFRRMKL